MRGGSDVLAPGPPETPQRWRDLRRRAISAAVLAPVVLACIWMGGVAFILLAGVGAVLSIVEWVRLCRPTAATGLLVVGAVWIAAACAGLLWVRGDPLVGRANLLFLMLLVWASDIGAYLVGRLVGGPKLAPRISPGKTWSGAAGGIAAAMLVGFAARLVLPTAAGPGWIAAMAGVLCVIGQLGDLAESWAKRHFGVKDSGTMIPGHGGLLDRLDALLAVAPFAALLALGLGHGVLFWE
jgi:phosphatidate cytidylyltransferase